MSATLCQKQLIFINLFPGGRYRVTTDVAEQFRYANQGKETRIPGTDDMADLERTRSAFTILGQTPLLSVHTWYSIALTLQVFS